MNIFLGLIYDFCFPYFVHDSFTHYSYWPPLGMYVSYMYVCIFVYWQTWHVKTHPFTK